MSSKIKNISVTKHTPIPDNLDILTRSQLQKLAKENGLGATAKSDTLKRNLNRLKLHRTLSHVTRLDTQLPRDLQDLVFKNVYDSINPILDEKIKGYFEVIGYTGNDDIVYDYSKIREALKIKHNITDKNLYNKLYEFKMKYVKPLLSEFTELDNVIIYFEQPTGATMHSPDDFKNIMRNINYTEERLRKIISRFNKYAHILKTKFNSQIKEEYLNEVNSYIIAFNKILKMPLPELLYSSNGRNRKTSLSRQTRSVKTKRISKTSSSSILPKANSSRKRHSV